jgi:serine/threonine protein kinase
MVSAGWVREYQDGEFVPGTPYCVLGLLGVGGMGSVYEVEHVELGRRYVLKSLLRTLAAREDLIARMRNEWRALGKLRHPNIVDVINAGITEGQVPYFVMELLDGETVRDRLERRGKLPVGEAVRIAQGTLLGLAAAHAIGVVHRDIKPANVFLTRDGGVKVLDFGIAQTRKDGMPKITAQGLAIGTPRYMSPEQAAGEKADARSDLYAVGLLLYEMLAGEGPFDDLSETTQQMLAHLHRPPRHLTRIVEIPPPLEALVERALAKKPDQRPRSAEYMAAELMPFAALELPAAARRARISSPKPATMSVPAGFPVAAKLSPAWECPTEELDSPSGGQDALPPAYIVPDFRSPARRLAPRMFGAGLATMVVAGSIFWAFQRMPRRPVDARTTLTPAAAPRPVSGAPDTRTTRSKAPMTGLAPDALAMPLESPPPAASVPPLPTARRKLRRAPQTTNSGDRPLPNLDVAELPPSGL